MNTINFTPGKIEELKSNGIFVFGSNLVDIHIGGTTNIAVQKFSAV